MTWLIIFGIILLFLCWILLAPLFVFISTSESRYEAGLRGILTASLKFNGVDIPEVNIKVFFIKFNIPIFKPRDKKEEEKSKKRVKKKKKKLSGKKIHFFIKLGWKILKSFKIKQLKLNIDTGDVINNAYLVPVFSMVYKERIKLSINYKNQNELILHFENNIGTILWLVVVTYIKQYFKK